MRVIQNQILYAIIIRKKFRPNAVEFSIDEDNLFESGFLKIKKEYTTKFHTQNTFSKPLSAMPKYILVKYGQIQIDLFNENKKKIKRVFLNQGDFIIHLRGPYRVTFLENSQIFETKLKHTPYSQTYLS